MNRSARLNLILGIGLLAMGIASYLGWSKYWLGQAEIAALRKENEQQREAALKAEKAAQDEVKQVKDELKQVKNVLDDVNKQRLKLAEQHLELTMKSLENSQKLVDALLGAKKPTARIALVLGGEIEYFDAIKRGAQRAAAELAKQGINLEVLPEAPARMEPAEQVKLVEQKLAGAKGLLLAPLGDKELVASVEKASKAGVPVVLIDRGLPGTSNMILKQVVSDPAAGGRLAAEHLLSLLDKEGKPAAKVVLLRFQKGVEVTEQREQAFLSVLNKRIEEQKKAGKPTLTILSSDQYAGAIIENAMRTAQNLLQQFGGQQIDAIATSAVPSTLGVLNALRQQGMAGKVKVIGFDETPELIGALRKGEVHGLVISDPFQIGYLGVWTLGQHLAGKDVRPAVKVLPVEQLVVTKENLDKPEVQAVLSAEKQKDRVIRLPQ